VSDSTAVTEQIADLLRRSERPVLCCHISPDGDALGSALGVALALTRLGAQPLVTFGDDPMVVPHSLSFLPGQHLLVEPDDIDDAPELVVAFDTGSIDRLGSMAKPFENARHTAVLDHHPSYTGFAEFALVDPSVPATAVLAIELIDRLPVPLDEEIATCLYTGLATDTGSFRYAGTTASTHELAARLLATGIPHDRIARHLWDISSFGYLKVLAAALERAVLEPEVANGLGIVWTVIPGADRARHEVGLADIEAIIDTVRKVTEAEVAVVAKEDALGEHKVSLRSKGRIDVSELASAMGGGGHRYAAGFTTYDDIAAVIAEVRRLVERAPVLGL
jgi:phosphoesterase RecJ-like protein